MSMFKNGGPAFPIEYMHWEHLDAPSEFKGMSLRDWFAGQLAAALVVHVFETAKRADKSPADGVDMVAALSFKVADALVAAREADPS